MKRKSVMLLCGAVAMLGLTGCGKTKINLDEYVELKYDGYDTIGTASYEFDYKQFERDFEDKLKMTKTGEDERKELKEAAEALGIGRSEPELLATMLAGDLDKTEGLSNGDEITYKWNIDDEEIAELFKVELTYSDITGTVEGLKEAEAFDPFEGYNVSFTGTAPDGRISIEDNRPSGNPRLNIELSQTDGLKNGDVITATAGMYGEDVTKYCVENYGKIPTATEREYTVDGLPTYVQETAGIKEETLQKMQKQVEDILAAEANGWNAASYLGSEYLGCYFLTPKPGAYANRHNIVTLVYRVDAHVNYEDGKFEADTSYYYGVTFYDIMDLPDGVQDVNVSSYDKKFQYHGHQVDTGFTWWGSPEMVSFNGYGSLDSMFSELVTSNVENWNYENTVEDKAPSYPVPETPAEEPAAE